MLAREEGGAGTHTLMYATYLAPLRGPRRLLRCAPAAFAAQCRDVQPHARLVLERWDAAAPAEDGAFHSAAVVREGATALVMYVETAAAPGAPGAAATNAPWARRRREDWDVVLVPLPSSPPAGVLRLAAVVRGLREFHLSLAGEAGWRAEVRLTRDGMDRAPRVARAGRR